MEQRIAGHEGAVRPPDMPPRSDPGAPSLPPQGAPEPSVGPSRISDLMPDTPMQKVVLPGLVDFFVGNLVVPGRFEPHRVSGYVTRLEDVPTGTAAELFRSYGLDQVPGWPPSRDLHVLRFYAHNAALYQSPYDRSVYQIPLMELAAGTELWRIDPTGTEQRVAAYLNRQIGWVGTAPVLLGPGRWNQAPVTLRPTVRRGAVATYRDVDYDVDFGPAPGEVTLHPLPGQDPPPDFTEQAGKYSLTVRIADLEVLAHLRWRGVWRGLTVELVESGPEQAVVHYVGDAGQRAMELGLAEVDYRVWRGPVPKAELAEVHQESISLKR